MKNNIDVVLLSPPSRSFNHYRPPMALIYLAGYLEHKGIKTKIIDITEIPAVRDKKYFSKITQTTATIKNEIIKQINENYCPIFGITCYTPEYLEVLELAREIKRIYPKSKVIIGGIHPTLYPDELLLENNSPVDFEVIGEGEETLFELVSAIKQNKRKYHNIKGIAYLDKKTKNVVMTPLRPVKDNLDLISFPAYDKIDMDYYTTASPYSIRGCFLRSVYMLATRGCPSTCTFCVAKKLRHYNGGGKYTRVRSARKLVQEISSLKRRYHIDSFYFIDDLFTINKENVKEFCRLLKQKKLNLLWGCSSKVSTLNEEIIKLMAESGCIQIDFGVERGSNQALIDVQKGISTEMIEAIFKYCHKYNIRTFANFLVNLPGETEKDLNDIAKFADKLNPDILSFNVFIPYPGTDIYDHAKSKFTKDEYSMLTYGPLMIKDRPDKFKFSKHNLDILKWANDQNRKFNRLLPNIKFHLQPKYLSTIFSSPKRFDYLKQTFNLFKELYNQKYST